MFSCLGGFLHRYQESTRNEFVRISVAFLLWLLGIYSVLHDFCPNRSCDSQAILPLFVSPALAALIRRNTFSVSLGRGSAASIGAQDE